MQDAFAVNRSNLSDDLVNAVRNMIVDGSLAAGERINEVHLSKSLGVSRTPLREALALLAREGTLRSVPRIGWFVKPLSLEEFDQLDAIRPLLDPEALRLSGLPSPQTIEELNRINLQLSKARDTDTIIALDDRFHLLLIRDCPNKILLELIGHIIQRSWRYEIGLMREPANVAVATLNHGEIIAALRARDLDAAVQALKHNLQTGSEPIRAWLKAREKENG